LDWFINNPSCEEVEIKIYCCQEISENYCDLRCGKQTYKIIIPKQDAEKYNYNEEWLSNLQAEKMYNIKEVEEIHVAVMKQGCLYEKAGWSDEHERLVRLEFKKWFEQNKKK
jgi:hypothetical protein